MPQKPMPAAGTLSAPVVREVRALAPQAAIDAALIATASRAWSQNTIRAFVSDLRLWAVHCKRNRTAPSDATPEDVAAYIRTLAGKGGLYEPKSAAAISRYLVHLVPRQHLWH